MVSAALVRRRATAVALAVVLVLSAAGVAPAPAGAQEFVLAQADGVAGESDAGTACEGRSVPQAGFSDARPNLHADAIDCVAWYGVAEGLTATQYGPGVRVNRAQMASFVARLIEAGGGALPPAGDQGFRDVDPSGVHAYAINRLAAAGIVRGTDATTYAPEAKVRRDQMATFLVNAYEHVGDELPEGSSGFTDIDGNTHEANITKAAEAGFARGVDNRTYAPAEPVRRDQMASFLTRVLERFAADGNTLEHLEPAGDVFVLRPDGYASVQLGDPAYDVVSQTAARLGPPTGDNAAECPSGADRQVSWDGLYLIFAEGAWQGYAVEHGIPAATKAGVEVGDTVAALRAAYPDVELTERTLGPEWFVDFGREGFLSGFLTGLEEDDQVTMISAGDKCVFR